MSVTGVKAVQWRDEVDQLHLEEPQPNLNPTDSTQRLLQRRAPPGIAG